jgi:hypothetical protein
MADVTQTCSVTGKQFVVNDWEQEHLKKFDVPLPTLCASERHRRRLAHRNERKIYNDVCDLTGKPMISLYSPDKDFKVYSPDAWWGDDWDPRDYGQDYDFEKPFFEQFAELTKKVPRLALMNKQGVNSDYCNITIGNKNCYLIFGGDYNEDSMYSLFNMHCRDTSDGYWVNNSELAYDSIDCINCYNIKYCQNANGCSDGTFLFECRNCQNCFGCVGLNGKKYHIFNKAYSKEEYEKKMKDYRLDSWNAVQKLKKEFAEFKLTFPHRFANIVNAENCSGADIAKAKNCDNCYRVEDVEDMKDVYLSINAKDLMSSDHVGHGGELYYEMLGSIEGYNNALCVFVWMSSNVFYSSMVDSCHDLFGCISMRRNEYCILNKQYTKAKYEEMVPKIIEHMKSNGEWGEFFPISISPFAYNESVAQDFFPMTKDEILAKEWKWMDEEVREIGVGTEVPDSILDVDDGVIGKALVCEKTGRPYQIIETELAFYKKMGVPVPRWAPETRHQARIAMMNPIQTWKRECAKCGAGIETSYAPERPEIVYCEECYLKEVY